MDEHDHFGIVGFSREILRLIRDHWQIFATAMTAAIYVSGLAYFHAIYAAFGLDSFAFTQPFPTVMAVGALAGLTSLVVELVMIAIFLALYFSILELARRKGKKISDDEAPPKTSGFREAVGLVCAAISILVLAALPWQWLGAELIETLLRIRASVIFVTLVTLGIVGITYLGALATLRARHKIYYVTILLIVALPGLTSSIGVHRAAQMEADPWSFPRVLIWDGENETGAEYTLIHQEDERLYVVKGTDYTDPTTNETERYYRVKVFRLSDLERVEYLPGGAETKRFRLEREAP